MSRGVQAHRQVERHLEGRGLAGTFVGGGGGHCDRAHGRGGIMHPLDATGEQGGHCDRAHGRGIMHPLDAWSLIWSNVQMVTSIGH